MKTPSIKQQTEEIFREIQFGDVAHIFRLMGWKYNSGRDSHIPDELELRKTVQNLIDMVIGEEAIGHTVSSGRFKVSYENEYLRVEFVPFYHDCDPAV